jgi:hypothetical protein
MANGNVLPKGSWSRAKKNETGDRGSALQILLGMPRA